MKDLVRNPIGIIALFISLIYGFASLLLGATADSLGPDEREPIIWFVVIFPCVVLAVFYFLVSRHHGKLYAPGDYKDDRSFLRTLSYEEVQSRLEREAEEALPEPSAADALTGEPGSTQSQLRTRATDIRTELRLVETLVIGRLEAEFGQRAEREIAVGETGAVFDAVIHGDKGLTFIEIKSLRRPMPPASLLDRVLYNAVLAQEYFESKFKLLLVVVFYFPKDELEHVETMWRRRIEKCPAEIQLRFMHRDDLEGG